MKRLGFFLALICIPQPVHPGLPRPDDDTLPGGDKYVGEWKDDQFAGPVK